MITPGIQELILFGLIIFVLNAAGIWPMITRGLRELRGETFDDPPPGGGGGGGARNPDLDLCYRLLGVSSTASMADIERAYKQKAKRHHPDLGGDEDAMKALNEAYARIKRSRGAR